MRRRHDILIDGKPYKQYTARGMLFGQVAEVPATPFAQKRGQGDTTLADSLTLSYFGMDSFHGGRGQDKARSPFAFMDSKRMITFIRDRAMPGPRTYNLLGATGVEHSTGNTAGVKLGIYPPGPYVESAFGQSFVCPSGGLTVEKIQFCMYKSDVGVDFDIEFALYDDSGGLPNTKLRSVTVPAADFETSYKWMPGQVTPYVLTPDATYHVVAEQLGYGDPFDCYYGLRSSYGVDEYPTGTSSGYKEAWAARSATSDFWFRINEGLSFDDIVTGAIEFYPSTADYIYRTLFFAMGKEVNYSDETAEGGRATGGTATTLQDTTRTFGVDTYNTGYTLYLIGGTGAGQSRDITDTTETELTVATWGIIPNNTTLYVVRKDAPQLQDSKTDFTNPVSDMKIFKDKLYVAQGLQGTSPIYTLTGATPTTTWAAVAGEEAEYLLIHVNADGDLALWRSFGNKIDCSTDGTNFGDDIEVGDQQYPITGMRVYAGDFIVFKEDGWYIIDLEEWKAERIINFETQPERDAFKAHCEYAGELYGSKAAGVWRYTPGPDMTPVGPDRGVVEYEATAYRGEKISGPWEPYEFASGWGLPEDRMGRISDMLALTNFMYVAVDAGEQDGRYSSILVYNRVGYGEIIRADSANEPIRTLHYSPEISPTPRLYWAEGKMIKYAKIADLSDNPYQWVLAEYVDEAELETSKYDAGRLLHRKTVIVCGVQSENLEEDHREIDVYYEADRSGLWPLWGTITRSPYQEIYMSRSDLAGSFVDNGGFEAWPDGPSDVEPSGWEDDENINAGTGTNNQESTNVKEGDYALRIEVSGINNGDYKGVSQDILSRLTVDTAYRLKVWIKNPAITNGRVHVFAWGDNSGTQGAVFSGDAHDEYTHYAVTCTPNGSDTVFEIYCRIKATANGCSGIAYIDAVEVERANEPIVASGSTPSVIKVDLTDGMIAGHWVRIENEHRQVLSVDSATQFTVTLPFPSAPASGSIVYGGWPVVHEIALKFRGTTDDMTEGWALCGFAGAWVPRPPREWSRTVLVEISDDAVEGRNAYQMWADLVALADRPEPIVYKDYWGDEHNVFVLEPQFHPLAMKEDAIDKSMERGYATVRMLDVKLS